MKKIAVLGSTGSIGRQTLDVVKSSPDQLEVVALVAGKNVDLIEEQTRQFQPKIVALMDERAGRELGNRLRDCSVKVLWGMEGILEIVTMPEVHTVVSALSGSIGLEPTLAAIKAGKDIALANKETLVAAGDLVMKTARKYKKAILPVDSEHSAIFQCLEDDRDSISKIIITASGGPFLHRDRSTLNDIAPEDALRHPNWAMGAKITIDSATMMNKGLEVIEAHHLFGLNYDQIEVLIHPQSIVHSMVEYKDGSVLAQLGRPDMRLPIAYALSYPKRWENPFERLDLRGKTLTFLAPDFKQFPALALAYEAGKTGGTMPAVMNGANEVAVRAFLEYKIPFLKIIDIVEQVCYEHKVEEAVDLETIFEADRWARYRAQQLVGDC